ncbi:hypothetical protein RND71_013193 [Anisodus tanguticus]|uniref:Protein kinase domain-containing protein n=1 Tax=Anisodus tanguticus TaxID=243964 RepID=A0AAE1VMF0_9SOLA|nr:hypothetical protein RND71_013193 [Anisodus tanguticus]
MAATPISQVIVVLRSTQAVPFHNVVNSVKSLFKPLCSLNFCCIYSSKFSKSMFQLSSHYIVSYKGYDVTKENDKLIFNLIIEYMSAGTIPDEIWKYGGRINESFIGYYTKQIVQGLEYLHSKGIAHYDIKGQNILLGKTGAKIADFGCARWVDLAQRDEPISGTLMFMAPEVARGGRTRVPM